MNTKSRCTKVKIIEQIGPQAGWNLFWNEGDMEFHETAADAFAAVKERDGILARAGMSMITVVEWTAFTTIGRQVVNALQ